MPTAPAAVLRRLPGWADAACELLHGGLSNRTWLLEKDGRRAVLKIDDAPRRPPFNTREQEAIIQAAAAEAGLANDVLYAADGIYLADYVAGEVWTAASFDDNRNVERLANVLRRVHALPRTGRAFDAAGAAHGYARHIESDVPLVTRCLKVVDGAGRPRRPRLCHNDLVAENILATPELRLLDWEYACDNDPLFDLAILVEHHDVDDIRAAHLLDAYFDGDGERHHAALRDQRRLYRALLWLWLAARPGTSEEELCLAAGRIATSCS